MKRSNSLENCLTLLLYFWMFPYGQGLLRSWFPREVSHLGMQWNLWNAEELGRRPAGIREQVRILFKDIQVYYFQGQRSTDLEGACPVSCSVQEALCSLRNSALSRPLLIASKDRRLTILTDNLFCSSRSHLHLSWICPAVSLNLPSESHRETGISFSPDGPRIFEGSYYIPNSPSWCSLFQTDPPQNI